MIIDGRESGIMLNNIKDDVMLLVEAGKDDPP